MIKLIIIICIELIILYIGIRWLYESFKLDITDIEKRFIILEKRISNLERKKK